MRKTLLIIALFAVFSATLPTSKASDFTISPTLDTQNNYVWGVNIGAKIATPNPKLTLYRGHTYTFDVNTSQAHPFFIKTEAGNMYPHISDNDIISSETVTLTLPNDAPDRLFYTCGQHASMIGVLDIPIFKDGFED